VQKVCTRSVCSVADVAVVAATYPFYTQARKRALLAPGLSIGFGAATRYTRYERYDSWPVFLLEMRTPLALRRPRICTVFSGSTMPVGPLAKEIDPAQRIIGVGTRCNFTDNVSFTKT
jgi:hypothetical protein